MKTLFTAAYVRNTVVIGVTSFMGLLLVYGLNNWLPTIMREADYELGAQLAFLLVLNVGAIAGLLVAGTVADRIGARAAGIAWFAGAALFLALLSIRLPIAGIYVMIFLTGCFVFSAQVLVYASSAPTTRRRCARRRWAGRPGRAASARSSARSSPARCSPRGWRSRGASTSSPSSARSARSRSASP